MAEVRWVVEIVCGFQWRVFVGWLCICLCVCVCVWVHMCVRMGCAWGVCGLCGGIFGFVGVWGMVFVLGVGGLGDSVLHMDFSHGSACHFGR